MHFGGNRLNQDDFGGSLDDPSTANAGDNQQQQMQQQMMDGGQHLQGQAMGNFQNQNQAYYQQQQMYPQQMDQNQFLMAQQQQQMMQQQQMGQYPQQQYSMQPNQMQNMNMGAVNQQMAQQMGLMGQQQFPGQMQPDQFQQVQQQAANQVQQPIQAAMPGQDAAQNANQAQAPADAKPDDSLAKLLAGGTKEFIPAGHVVKTEEQFPDLDALDDAPKKGKKEKKKKKPAAVVAQDEVVDESTAWKGRPSKFFVMPQTGTPSADGSNPMNYEMNDEQWNFIFKYYPEYGSGPYDLMVWLFNQSEQHESVQQNYQGGPAHGGRKVQAEDDDDFDAIMGKSNKKIDKAFGKPGQLNKQDAAKKQREKEVERQKFLEERKANVQPGGKSEQERKEEQLLKAFKDRQVNMNPENCEQVDETREPVSMVFIGHVDAGKSTICGNLMYLMGVVDQRTIEKYKQEAKEKNRDSWWLAYVMDVSDEEKAKGKTVEVGRAQFDTKHKKYTIFDAPGHKNYVPNMIMGAALADVAGLVISARKGEFEAGFEKDGQTREHAQLAKSLGVQKLIVVVNKMDDCKWSKSRYDEIQTGLTPFLKATGYGDDDILWIPISGLTGANIHEPIDQKTCNWYKGPTFLEIIDEVQLQQRFPAGTLIITILYKMKDPNIIAHGKVENGSINLGDKLAIMPSGAPAQVIGLLDAKGRVVKYATPGENVQVKLNVADEDQVQRGFVLCHRDSMMPVTDTFEAELDILDLVEYKPIISKGYTCMMHIHTHQDEVTISHLVKLFEKNEKGEITEKMKPQFAKSQSKIICRIQPRNPVSIEKFTTIQQMGRFTLRDEGKTICVGKVLKYKPYTRGGFFQASGQTEVDQVTQQLDNTQINSSSSAPPKELVFNMETGETTEKAKALDAIAEGEEDN